MLVFQHISAGPNAEQHSDRGFYVMTPKALIVTHDLSLKLICLNTHFFRSAEARRNVIAGKSGA